MSNLFPKLCSNILQLPSNCKRGQNWERIFTHHFLPEASRGSRNPGNSSSSLLLSGRSRSTNRACSDINPVVFKNSRRSKGFTQNNPMMAVEVRLKTICRF